MIEVNKVVTLEGDEKFLIIKDLKMSNDKFFLAVKLENDKYVNDFRVFIESNKGNDKYLEEITDESIIKLIVDKLILEA